MSDEERDFAGIGSDGDLDFSGIVGKKKSGLSDEDDFDGADFEDDDIFGDDFKFVGDDDDFSF